MTNVLRSTLFAIAAFGLLTSPAFAGGGGSKSNPTLTVENDAESTVYVVVDPRSDFQARVFQRLVSGASPDFDDAFTDLGGVILQDGEEKDYSVRKGSHSVHVAFQSEVDAALLGGGTVDEIRSDIEDAFESEDVNVQSDTTVRVSEIFNFTVAS